MKDGGWADWKARSTFLAIATLPLPCFASSTPYWVTSLNKKFSCTSTVNPSLPHTMSFTGGYSQDTEQIVKTLGMGLGRGP